MRHNPFSGEHKNSRPLPNGRTDPPYRQPRNRRTRGHPNSRSDVRTKSREHHAPAARLDRTGTAASVSRAASAEQLRPGDVVVVTVKRIGINGEGIGYFRRKAVFVPGALPGEVVKARVTAVHPRHLEAEAFEYERRSPDRTEAPCPVYGPCGGCQLQHLRYDAQLRAKEELVRESFERYAGMASPPIRPILGADDPWGYRNKAQLRVGVGRDGPILGLYAPGSHRLIEMPACAVQHPVVNRAVEAVRGALREVRVPVWNEKTGEGALKSVVVRASRADGRVQVTFVTAGRELPGKNALIRELRRRLPELASVAQNINPDRTPLVFGDETLTLWGNDRLDETLGRLRLRLSPRAFFQLNPEQTVRLYDTVLEAAALTGRERVVDAFCGTGTIALWLAPHAAEVRGVESVAEAVADARENARTNGAANAFFFEGTAEHWLAVWEKKGFRPDVVVADPPRTGCGESLLRTVLDMRPPRFVYVSCNPATLAKDCRRLLDGGYRLEWLQPVDMFPQTAHVECCALLVAG